MEKDTIKTIEIDNEGRLHLITSQVTFPMIYRTATEVHWNPQKHSLYSPKPIDWNYEMWYDHIVKVAEAECYCKLELSEKTTWLNVPEKLKQYIKR